MNAQFKWPNLHPNILYWLELSGKYFVYFVYQIHYNITLDVWAHKKCLWYDLKRCERNKLFSRKVSYPFELKLLNRLLNGYCHLPFLSMQISLIKRKFFFKMAKCSIGYTTNFNEFSRHVSICVLTTGTLKLLLLSDCLIISCLKCTLQASFFCKIYTFYHSNLMHVNLLIKSDFNGMKKKRKIRVNMISKIYNVWILYRIVGVTNVQLWFELENLGNVIILWLDLCECVFIDLLRFQTIQNFLIRKLFVYHSSFFSVI